MKNLDIKYVVCSVDENYQDQLFVMLTSLFAVNQKNKFHIFILNEGIETELKKKIGVFFNNINNSSFTILKLNNLYLDKQLIF